MSNDDNRMPPDEWLAKAHDQVCVPPLKPTVDDLHRLAQSLDPDEKLRLVTRLWTKLPADHRAALATLHVDELYNPRDRVSAPAPIWQFLNDRLFDVSKVSDLYSAPRRFDLATIFVVTAAYSLLFGGLTALSMPAAVKVIVGGLITVVAVAQALFLKVANPRGVSIVSGALGLSVMLGSLSLVVRHVFPEPFFVVVICGLVGGAFAGYLAGVLVGGVFLVADALRGKFEGRSHSETNNTLAIDVDPLSADGLPEIETAAKDKESHGTT